MFAILWRGFTVSTVTVGLAACTDLETLKLKSNDEVPPPSGLVYKLPMSQYQMEARWLLVGCPTKDELLERAKRSPTRVALVPDFKVRLSATGVYVGDPSASYAIDYKALSGLTKTSSFNVEFYENGTLKNINATVTDRTTETAQAFIRTGFKVARLATGVPELPAVGEVPLLDSVDMKGLGCTNGAASVLKQRAKTKKKLSEATKELEAATADVVLKQAIVAANAKPSSGAVKALEDALTKSLQVESRVSKTKAVLAGIEDYLSVTVSKNWPKKGADTDTMISLQANKLSRLVEVSDYSIASAAVPRMKEVALNDFASSLSLRVDLVKLVDLKQAPYKDGETVTGLAYRSPAKGYLQSCLLSDIPKNEKSCSKVDLKKLVSRSLVDVPQHGTLSALPLSNGIGQDNQIEVTFFKSGAIDSFGYVEKSASLEKIAGVFDTAANEALTFRDALRNTELEDLQRRIAEVNAANELQAAIEAGETDETAEELEQVQAESALLSAKLERLRAQKAFNSDASDAPAGRLQAIQEEIALKKAKLELLEAEKKLDEFNPP